MKRFFDDIKGIWQRFKDLVPKVLDLGDRFGEVVVEAYELARDTWRTITSFLGRIGGAGVLVGLTSPLSGGWGTSWLGKSTLSSWGPVVICPLLGVLLRSMAHSFVHLDREGEGDFERDEGARGGPDTERELRKLEQTRALANSGLTAVRGRKPLYEDPLLVDILADAQVRLATELQIDFGLVLLRWTKKHRLRPVAAVGRIDEEVSEVLVDDWEGVLHFEEELRYALERLRFHHHAVEFVAGRHHYILVGISATALAARARLEISRIATELVKRYADEDEETGSMKGDQ